jgi:hypothetical protein
LFQMSTRVMNPDLIARGRRQVMVWTISGMNLQGVRSYALASPITFVVLMTLRLVDHLDVCTSAPSVEMGYSQT